MKHIVVISSLVALLSAGAVYAAAPDAVNGAVKACCEAMEKCCCCDKADGKDSGQMKHN